GTPPASLRSPGGAIRLRRGAGDPVAAQAHRRRDPVRSSPHDLDLGAPVADRAPGHAAPRGGSGLGLSPERPAHRPRTAPPAAGRAARRQPRPRPDDEGPRGVSPAPRDPLPLRGLRHGLPARPALPQPDGLPGVLAGEETLEVEKDRNMIAARSGATEIPT